MKQKISVTIDEEKVSRLDEVLAEGNFRNKSHIVEYSITKFLEGFE